MGAEKTMSEIGKHGVVVVAVSSASFVDGRSGGITPKRSAARRRMESFPSCLPRNQPPFISVTMHSICCASRTDLPRLLVTGHSEQHGISNHTNLRNFNGSKILHRPI